MLRLDGRQPRLLDRAGDRARADAAPPSIALGDRLAGEADLLVQQRGLAVGHVAVGQADAQDPRHRHAGVVERLPDGASRSRRPARPPRPSRAARARPRAGPAGRASIGLAKRASATVAVDPAARPAGRPPRAPCRRRCRSRAARPASPSRRISPVPISIGARLAPAAARRRPRRAGSAARPGRRRSVSAVCSMSHEHRLVARRHQHDVRQAAQVGDVERAVVGRAVVADEAGAVHREDDVELLQADVVDDLVVARAAGTSSRSRATGLAPCEREAGGEQHRLLLGDADVEVAVGHRLLEDVEAGAGVHRGGDADDARVAPALRAPAPRRTPSCTAAAPARRAAWLDGGRERRWRSTSAWRRATSPCPPGRPPRPARSPCP